MYDIVIIGAGTAGLSAAIYGVRAGKTVLVLEGENYGGQIINSPEVENYPGIAKISGFEFATGLYEQAQNLGAVIEFEAVTLSLIHIFLVNDIKTHHLDPERERTILGFYLGTGFGNAVYINGQLHVGKNGVAGELGHIPMYGIDEACTCGNIGCSETRCSGRYLKQ